MICEICGNEFSIDWRKNKEARKTPCKFCSSSCSRVRKHSKETKEKISNSLTKREKQYCKCGNELSKNNRSGMCCKCISKNKKTSYQNIVSWRNRKKEELVKYKGGKCEVCGYSRCLKAMDFHHLDPNEKEFTISSKIRGLDKLYEEVDKCILVCSNCHREIHAGTITLPEQNIREIIPSV